MEFLIDNCFEIFGENIPTHSRITSDDSLEHTDSSGTEHSVTDCASGEKPMPEKASLVLEAGFAFTNQKSVRKSLTVGALLLNLPPTPPHAELFLINLESSPSYSEALILLILLNKL